MKKVFSAISALCLLTALTVVTNAAEDVGEAQVVRKTGVERAQARIPGKNDKRIITPDMDNRERYEVMRNIKKRAAAKRNSLMLQAAQQRQEQKQVGSPGQIIQN